MATLTKIGNSQGVRIPKAYIKQAHLQDCELEFKITSEGLLIVPSKNTPRKSWEADIKKVLEHNKDKKDEAVDEGLLNDSDLESLEW